MSAGHDGHREALREPVGETHETTQPASWLERTSDLLREPDPGPTPFLVNELIVAQAIAALVGMYKVAKTWVMLELAISIVAGREAFGCYPVDSGPVILVMEESGRAAYHRRIDRLGRGYALEPDALADLHFAANLGVRLNDPVWQERLLGAVAEIKPKVVMLDPFVRLKGATVNEDRQREIGPVLDFIRLLRDESGGAVLYSNHTGHQGTHQRGSSDLEGYWESRLAVSKDEAGTRTVVAEHREAESGHEFRFTLAFDEDTRTLRIDYVRSDLELAVERFLRANPTASKNAVATAVDGRRSDVLRLYDVVKARLEQRLWTEE